uniref:Histone domain-containing protein n=1 Tax=Mesocestoides corti TaxID=53468 RepID=A0A5K3G433_MESCO
MTPVSSCSVPLDQRASFARAVRSIAQRTRIESALTLRWQASALDCLQEAAEAFLVDLFSYAALAAAHAKRVTVKPVDLHLVCRFIHFLQ